MQESESRLVAELTEKLRRKDEEDESNALHLDSLCKEKDRIERELKQEKQANLEQMERILKLNEELIAAIEEKQQLQRTIQERDVAIEELRMAIDTPDKYVEKVLHGASCES